MYNNKMFRDGKKNTRSSKADFSVEIIIFNEQNYKYRRNLKWADINKFG